MGTQIVKNRMSIKVSTELHMQLKKVAAYSGKKIEVVVNELLQQPVAEKLKQFIKENDK